jgi:glucokinase
MLVYQSFRLSKLFGHLPRTAMSRTVIGVDLGGTNLRTALLTAEGEILDRHKQANCGSEGWKKVVERLIEDIKLQRENAGKRDLEIAAIGVGAPGVIQVDAGVVVKSPNFPDWNNLPLRNLLEEALMVPVVIENDANAAALGEQWRGAGRDITSMILLTLGTGVGGGIILDKKIWHGADGMAGEIGHMTLIPDGRPCSCRNRGCLEMYASARGIVQSYQEALDQAGSGKPAVGPQITAADVYEAARKGNAIAATVMRGMGRMLGIGIANLINIFNPERIVIGGGVKDAWPLFIDAAKEEIMRRAFEVPAKRTEIVPSLLGDDAGLVGAAAVALQKHK